MTLTTIQLWNFMNIQHFIVWEGEILRQKLMPIVYENLGCNKYKAECSKNRFRELNSSTQWGNRASRLKLKVNKFIILSIEIKPMFYLGISLSFTILYLSYIE